MKNILVVILIITLWLALLLWLASIPYPEVKEKTTKIEVKEKTTKIDFTKCPTLVEVTIIQPDGLKSEVHYATTAYWTSDGRVISLNLGMTKCPQLDIRPRFDERVEIRELY